MQTDNTAAIEAARAQGRPTWPYEPLYTLLHGALPAFRLPSGILDVPTLADHLGVTSESIYRWFRSGELAAGRARELLTLIEREDNTRMLADEDRQAPTLPELYEFCK